MLSLLSPKKLTEEVQVYGYHFSWKSNLLAIVGVLLGMGAIGILFRLKAIYFVVFVFVVILLFPTFVLLMYRQMYEQKRFADAVTYVEQILYSFQKNGKIISALRETSSIFEEGKMQRAIEAGIEYMEEGMSKTTDGVLREALSIIEKAYDCTKVRAVHSLLLNSEEHGGEMDASIFLLLDDIESWKRRGYRLQADKKISHRDTILSIIVATVLCAISLYSLNAMAELFPVVEGVDIFSAEIIQISSFVFLIFLLYVLFKSFKSLTVDWLKNESHYEEKYIVSCYRKIREYDERKEKKKSMLFSLLLMLGAMVMFLIDKFSIGVALVLGAGIMLMQHRIGYNMAKKDVNNELYMELPQWLMEIALLLQNNNVQVSIIKSVDNASPVMQIELYKLIERIELAPDELASYVKFCKGFDVPEIQSCMKMLHAISETGTGDSKVQVNNLVKRVQEMQLMADEIKAKDQAFQMKMLFSYPVIGATVKLLLDLSVGMFYMFSMIGSMGGA